VARRTGPSSTWLARVAKLSEDSVSDVELASGDTQHMSSTFADPHSESCSTCTQQTGSSARVLILPSRSAGTRRSASVKIHLRELRVAIWNMRGLMLESTDDVSQRAKRPVNVLCFLQLLAGDAGLVYPL